MLRKIVFFILVISLISIVSVTFNNLFSDDKVIVYNYDSVESNLHNYGAEHNFQPVMITWPTIPISDNAKNTKLIFYNSFDRKVEIDRVILEYCNNTRTEIREPEGTQVYSHELNETFTYYDSEEQTTFVNTTQIVVNLKKEIESSKHISPGKYQIIQLNINYTKFLDMNSKNRYGPFNDYVCKFSIYEQDKKIEEGFSNMISNQDGKGSSLYKEAVFNY